MAYEIGRRRKSLFGSLSVNSTKQVWGMFCLGRRGGEMGDGGYVLYIILRIWDCGVSGES